MNSSRQHQDAQRDARCTPVRADCWRRRQPSSLLQLTMCCRRQSRRPAAAAGRGGSVNKGAARRGGGGNPRARVRPQSRTCALRQSSSTSGEGCSLAAGRHSSRQPLLLLHAADPPAKRAAARTRRSHARLRRCGRPEDAEWPGVRERCGAAARACQVLRTRGQHQVRGALAARRDAVAAALMSAAGWLAVKHIHSRRYAGVRSTASCCRPKLLCAA